MAEPRQNKDIELDSGRVTRDSEVSQFASPLMCLLARTIAVEESVIGD